MKKIIIILFAALAALPINIQARKTYNFNSGWAIGKQQNVTLPRAWNEFDAFRVNTNDVRDSVIMYSKHFRLPKLAKGERVMIEFEGAKQAAEVTLNGKYVGLSENGVMAFGFDLTPFLKKGDNFIEVKTDNHTEYREKSSGTKFQWNYNNFNANYGGITKNVKLHICPAVYQTLPLYRDLGTTGTYVYGSGYDVKGHAATVNVESEVFNSSNKVATLSMKTIVEDKDGQVVGTFESPAMNIPAGQKVVLKANKRLSGLHFWSWGYGYLYRVKTIVGTDTVTTVTGFRKTEFKDGLISLNDRVMMVHGYAQRSTNEWACVGNAVPAWMSDYSNNLFIESGGNVVRWMHITPGKQDIESCDRVGLIQAMPAGDSEGDSNGRQWEQRVEVMRDAIIYNRNNPSILFYESGNNNISDEHMADMLKVRNQYDPCGGRAIGSRNMLSTKVAEYGGEMLYINKSKTIPMWQMEYCRDEGLRKYWNEWSYPYHKEGVGPLYRGALAPAYNHNQDELTAEFVRRWYDYWMERPGQGTKVNSGGVKIVFSDSQTHSRGEANYRTSGVVDPLRIPKDGFFAHQVMWTGWVDDYTPKTYIVGHWNYKDGQILPRVYVVSNGDSVTLSVNGNVLPAKARNEYRYLFTFDSLKYVPGTLTATAYSAGKKESEYSIETAGEADHIKLTTITDPTGWKADGADIAMVQVEVVDKQGRRCPLDNSHVKFSVSGPAEYLGGVAQGRADNYARCDTLPVDAGVNRVMLRSLTTSGNITVNATVDGMKIASVSLATIAAPTRNGLSEQFSSDGLKCQLDKGETPAGQSFVQTKRDVEIVSATAAVNADKVKAGFDDDESTSWGSDSNLANSWITYTLAEDTPLEEICLKMVGFRSKSYPLEIYAGKTLVWKGYTQKSISYLRLPLLTKGIHSFTYTIKMVGTTQDGDAFSGVKEVDKKNDEKRITGSNTLRILEAEFIAKK
jgi:beta-galactosidase